MNMQALEEIKDLTLEVLFNGKPARVKMPNGIQMIESQILRNYGILPDRYQAGIETIFTNPKTKASARWMAKDEGAPWEYTVNQGETWIPCSREEAWNWLVNGKQPSAIVTTVTHSWNEVNIASRLLEMQQQTLSGNLEVGFNDGLFTDWTFADVHAQGMKWGSFIVKPGNEEVTIKISNRSNGHVITHEPMQEVWQIYNHNMTSWETCSMLEALEYLLESKYPDR